MLEISRKLKILMGRNRYSQAQLARKLGVSQPQVSNWVTGKSRPDVKETLALARLFDVSMEYLADDGLEDESAYSDAQLRDVVRTAKRLGYEVAMDRLTMAPKYRPIEAPTEQRPSTGGGKARGGGRGA